MNNTLFYTCKRVKNDVNGNGRWAIVLLEYDQTKGILLDRSYFLAGKLRNTKEGYIIKSVNVQRDLQNILKSFELLQII